MMEKDKSTVLLEYSLKKLKLPTMLREYAPLATVCQKDRSDYPTYLLRLTERELLDREKRAAERRIKDANFPVIKTIDTYDFSSQPSINEPLVRELLRGEYLNKRENVLFIGNPGTGKTHLVCALAFSACAQGRNVGFYTAADLVTQLVECREEKRLLRLHKQLQKLHLLVIDELGYVPFELGLRGMDGDLWLRATHRRLAGPAHSPVPHPGGEWGKLQAATGQEKI
jgi:DNA replication protein DnaC